MCMIDENMIREFLVDVDKDFPIPLSTKVKLDDYSKKLFEKSNFCYRVNSQNELIALVAGYIDNVTDNTAYIAIVACKKEYRKQHISSELVQEFLDICKQHNLQGCHLYTDASNSGAIKMYKRLNFKIYSPVGEQRVDDIHLIHNFKK